MLDSKTISQEFVHWLDGYLEAFEGKSLDKEQTKKIIDRLNLVFHHEIDPKQDAGRDAKELRKIHRGDGSLTQQEIDALISYDSERDTIKDMC